MSEREKAAKELEAITMANTRMNAEGEDFAFVFFLFSFFSSFTPPPSICLCFFLSSFPTFSGTKVSYPFYISP